ncbi:MAG: type ISP restriction/modification enzyme, partial [Candidatus Zixiibacteriota bacterium]
TNVLGEGPAAVATALIPDLHHFRGSFGGAHIIPLWRDATVTRANITSGVLETLAQTYGHHISPEDFFAYCYAVLATPRYVQRFWDELTIPGPRVPITRDAALFAQSVELGRRLLWLHTYGERFVPQGNKPGKVPPGKARCKVGTPATPEAYPEDFSYNAASRELHVGKGVFSYVRPEVWKFSVSGLQVVKSWLAYRMRKRAGRKSSPLDEIRPTVWQFDEELLDLLWVLDATVDLLPSLAKMLDEILAGELFEAKNLPQPIDVERQGLKDGLPLFDIDDTGNEAYV